MTTTPHCGAGPVAEPISQPAARGGEDYLGIFRNGLWDNNAVFTQMLALCPLMAVTTTATNGLGMGIASTGVLLASNVVIASCYGAPV